MFGTVRSGGRGRPPHIPNPADIPRQKEKANLISQTGRNARLAQKKRNDGAPGGHVPEFAGIEKTLVVHKRKKSPQTRLYCCLRHHVAKGTASDGASKTFSGKRGKRRLLEAIKSQTLISGNFKLASEAINSGVVKNINRATS